MTDRPYTNADLITEAARQHCNAVADPGYEAVGRELEGSWDGSGLDPDAIAEAHGAVYELLSTAADTSVWAIRLGADGLQPSGHALDLGPSGAPPRVRIHFAFAPDMAEQDRADLIAQIAAFTIHGLT